MVSLAQVLRKLLPMSKISKKVPAENFHERLVSLGTAQITQELQIDADSALRTMQAISNDLADEYGGRTAYVPMYGGLDKADRNMAVLAEYDGNNVEHLSNKYGLDEAAILSIVKMMIRSTGSHMNFLPRLLELGTSRIAKELCIERECAQRIMASVTNNVRIEYGGCCMYMTKNVAAAAALKARNEKIYAEVGKKSVTELSREHKISYVQVYNIINKMRKSKRSQKAAQ